MKFLEFISPMLLSEQERPFDDENYIFELKFDGIRAMVHASPKEVRVYSRRGNDVTDVFPELQSIKKLVDKKVIFDGEIVSFENGVPSFSKLQRRNLLKDSKKIFLMSKEEPIAFVVFDCIYEGKSLVNLSLVDRKKVLEKYPDTEVFIKTKYIFQNGKKLFRDIVKIGLEGIVAKKADSTYQVGVRTKDWIKIKNFRGETFLIGGYIENKVKASLLLGEYRDQKFYCVGKVSIERHNPLYAKLRAVKDMKKTPFCDYDDETAIYVPLKYSCEVSYIERTPSGNLRQPVFIREVKKGN